jgi:DNA-binding transcriptional LysR family regulator
VPLLPIIAAHYCGALALHAAAKRYFTTRSLVRSPRPTRYSIATRIRSRIVCATPAYLQRYGAPADLAALDGHQMVGLRMGTTGNLMPMEFGAGANVQGVTLPCAMSVTGTESYLCAIRPGLGIAQVPRFHVEPDLQSGALVQVFAHVPQPAMPVSLVYQRTRQLSPRVRVFIDWAVREFANRHAPAAGDSIGA